MEQEMCMINQTNYTSKVVNVLWNRVKNRNRENDELSVWCEHMIQH